MGEGTQDRGPCTSKCSLIGRRKLGGNENGKKEWY